MAAADQAGETAPADQLAKRRLSVDPEIEAPSPSGGIGSPEGRSTGGPFFPKPPPLYNETWRGVFGEFGSGKGLRAFYLQTAIPPRHLDKVSLVKDMQGSEHWRVRDLFQREVDDERVSRHLVPYLADGERIKFFNALILTVLPVERSNGRLLDQMPQVAEKTVVEDGQEWLTLEREELFRVRRPKAEPQFAELQWNSEKSAIVAIDGQHRLSALKQLTAWVTARDAKRGDSVDPHGDSESLLTWRIPIVVVSFRVAAGREEPPSVLEVVRSIFVDINTKAQTVSRARQILLDDRSVNSLAAQEILERAHANDLKPRGSRRRETVPLLLFDWRGLERDGKALAAPAAAKTIVEIRDWFEHYILGDDFCSFQAKVLDVDGDDDFELCWKKEALDHRAAGLARTRLGEFVIPALCHLLENFEPYRRYIELLRVLEDQYTSGHGLHQHAFDRLRFGSSGEEEFTKHQVDDIEGALVVEIKRAQGSCLIPATPIRDDIGMRGIVQSFGYLLRRFQFDDWTEYTEWFVAALNEAYAEGWFEAKPGGRAHSHLRHVVLSHSGTTVNYRLQDAEKALGPYVSLLVGAFSPPPEHWGTSWSSDRNRLLRTLRATLVRGFKKEVHAAVLERFPKGGTDLTAAKKVEAEKLAGRQMRRFENELKNIAARA